jgi:anti-anti-sigma factor
MARFESPSVSVTPHGSAAAGGDAECTVVWLQGGHDIGSTDFLVAAFDRADELDGANVLVDLGAVTFMDASTAGVIIGARNRLRLQARTLEVRAPSPAALRLLELCDLTQLIRSTTAAVHPTGVAGALHTWVEVPPSPSRPSTSDAAPTPEVHVQKAATLSEVNSGGS